MAKIRNTSEGLEKKQANSNCWYDENKKYIGGFRKKQANRRCWYGENKKFIGGFR